MFLRKFSEAREGSESFPMREFLYMFISEVTQAAEARFAHFNVPVEPLRVLLKGRL